MCVCVCVCVCVYCVCGGDGGGVGCKLSRLVCLASPHRILVRQCHQSSLIAPLFGIFRTFEVSISD